jgi:hypothetical protein
MALATWHGGCREIGTLNLTANDQAIERVAGVPRRRAVDEEGICERPVARASKLGGKMAAAGRHLKH